MTRHIAVVLALAVLLGPSTTYGDWKMRVHRAGAVVDIPIAEIDSISFVDAPPMILVPSGTFTMGDGMSPCAQDERTVILTNSFYIGQYEITNQEYLDAVQWAFDRGYVTVGETYVQDNLDGSSDGLLHLDAPCEISFNGGVFSLRDVGHGINPDHPVIEVSWFGAARYCDWLSLQEGLPRAYEH